nr:TRAP transporter small permease [uncultured Cohaesibacter sp.]
MATEPGVSCQGREGPVPFLRFFDLLIEGLAGSGKVIAFICLTFMFIALLVNVVLRYAFGAGIAWAYEIHALLLPWLVAGGIVVASARGGHIAIRLLPEMLDERPKRLLLIIIQLVLIIVALGILYSSPPILRAAQYQSLSTLGIKQFWGYLGLIYAFACMAIIALCEIVRLIGGVKISTPPPDTQSLS